MMAGAYTLDLYCDNPEHKHGYLEFPHQFIGETGAECRKAARQRGWIIIWRHKAYCPKCKAYARNLARIKP